MNAKPVSRGFTLVEMVVVMAITAIVVTMVAVFFKYPMNNYVDTADRAQLADTADIAMRRLSRELHLALPNSLRVTQVGTKTYVEFLLTRTGGRYQDQADSSPNDGKYLSWNDTSKTSFTVVGDLSSDTREAIQAGDYLVVANYGENQNPANAYDCSSTCNRAQIDSSSTTSITLHANPFPNQSPAIPSPDSRFMVVSTPVTYVCDTSSGTLMRYWNYDIQATQPTSASALSQQDPNRSSLSPQSAMLANGVAYCEFKYQNLANTRQGMLGFGIGLKSQRDANANIVSLFHQIHVDNIP